MLWKLRNFRENKILGNMSAVSFYCFRCGDPLKIINGEFYCAQGDMYVSKFLSDLLTQAASAAAFGDSASPVEKSHFRCIRCRGYMKQMGVPGTGIHCPACGMHYTPRMTYNMIERHAHAKFLEPGQKPLCSVVVTRKSEVTSGQLAEQIQLRTHSSAKEAWRLTQEIETTGRATIFTGHPQDAELICSTLNVCGIPAELVDGD
jgi:hypothetical protein